MNERVWRVFEDFFLGSKVSIYIHGVYKQMKCELNIWMRLVDFIKTDADAWECFRLKIQYDDDED